MEIYPKLKTGSTTFRSFCERLRDSLLNGNLGKRDHRVIKFINYRVTREYRINQKDFDEVFANFFVERKWERYIRAIEMMDNIRWRL
jgi:hypothetical protein